GDYNLIQIDTSVSGGNSGGPILNRNGEVVGLTTYKISQGNSADFNAGVSVDELTKMVKENKISLALGDVSGYITSGVSKYEKAYYKLAVSDFKKAIELYKPASET